MWKKAVSRMFISMAVASLVCQAVLLVTSLCMGKDGLPLVPSYRAHFPSDTAALGVHVLLTGVIGAAFGGLSVLFEIERWSLLKQGVLHFVLTAAVWVPLAVFLWGLDRYPAAVPATLLSFALTYGVTWWLNYRQCRKSVRQINEKLKELREEEG